MPRQRRSAASVRSAPSRPQTTATRNVTPPQQPTRSMATAAHPPAATQQPKAGVQAGQTPGLFGQMASTAAGVAVGSSIGHAIGGFFGGGSGQVPVDTQQGEIAFDSPSPSTNHQDAGGVSRVCEVNAKDFNECMTQTNGSITACQWYLDQLVSVTIDGSVD
ncbi:hypothetical protein MMC09_002945 [Bachmanniomyces sp. S44760]|nr:hypothetical protein [Bachmanniomyces sp. S44760]